MTAIDPKILSKIKKCLALSNSPNPHEAAAAMRQAQALMRKYGVEAHDVSMSEVGEATVNSRTMARDKPANWELTLAAMVGKAFGCQMLISRSVYKKEYRAHANEGKFIFIGQKAQAEIAAYTAEVLARKCKSSRQTWIKENSEAIRSAGGNKSTITRMGDAFSEGWVGAIGQLVQDFANPPDIEQAITQIIASRSRSDTKFTGRELKKIGENERTAARMGFRAAKGESLYRPMATERENLRLA